MRVACDVGFLPNGIGSVLRSMVVIEYDMCICRNVTIGEAANWWGCDSEARIACTGAKVLGYDGPLHVGRGIVVVTKVVLTMIAGEDEI